MGGRGCIGSERLTSSKARQRQKRKCPATEGRKELHWTR
nr:MAG TPA: hypothetical protein [Caudoviricetes sp.]